jgi:hypothetical protein
MMALRNRSIGLYTAAVLQSRLSGRTCRAQIRLSTHTLQLGGKNAAPPFLLSQLWYQEEYLKKALEAGGFDGKKIKFYE